MLIRPGTYSLIGKTMRERRKDGGEREMADGRETAAHIFCDPTF